MARSNSHRSDSIQSAESRAVHGGAAATIGPLARTFLFAAAILSIAESGSSSSAPGAECGAAARGKQTGFGVETPQENLPDL